MLKSLGKNVPKKHSNQPPFLRLFLGDLSAGGEMLLHTEVLIDNGEEKDNFRLAFVIDDALKI